MPDCRQYLLQPEYVVRAADDQRDNMVKYLKHEGIGCEVYCPQPCPLSPGGVYFTYGTRRANSLVAEAACKSVLALPIFPEIAAAQQESGSYLQSDSARNACTACGLIRGFFVLRLGPPTEVGGISLPTSDRHVRWRY
jgi:hypothetical protein